VIVGDFLVFCWRFFGVLLVFFGNVVDEGFLDRISWGSFVVISPALQKFPTREKKLQKRFLARALAKKKKKEEEQKLIYVLFLSFFFFFKKNMVLAMCFSSTWLKV
jgi:hypothetical protein